MDKNKGIWIVIGSILVIGILITFATTSYIKSKENNLDLERYGIKEKYGEVHTDAETQSIIVPKPKSPIESEDIKEDSGEAFGQEQSKAKLGKGAQSKKEDSVDEKLIQDDTESTELDSVNDSMISPKNGLPDTELKKSADYYQKHLEDLDAQIENMRKESLSTNTYSMKVMSDKEFELWDREQQVIYQAILDKLSDEDKTVLKKMQKSFIKIRDATAEEASKKYSGGSLEELEYTASLAESSRDRAYELVEKYKEVLSTDDEK